jgi:gamma-glutamyl:cysteine ligase YbdK (ATP-grasp superfamily)
MKFGLESEKFLIDLKNLNPSRRSSELLDSLKGVSDPAFDSSRVCHEFVHHMVEINTIASSNPIEVLTDYQSHLVKVIDHAKHLGLGLLPLASIPFGYSPQMLSLANYQLQNSILSNRFTEKLILDVDTPLLLAANCAGMHVHAEIQGPISDIMESSELIDKFNLGLMLSPLIACSSSPYFFNTHEAHSMRGLSYFERLYSNYPHNGKLPPLMHSTSEVIQFMERGEKAWFGAGWRVGHSLADVKRMFSTKGVQWNPVRWNKRWNTIELRFFDSDFLFQERGKFAIAVGAMNRLNTHQEGLSCEINQASDIETQVGESFTIKEGKIKLLNDRALALIFKRAIISGLHDPFVQFYLRRLVDFSIQGLPKNLMVDFSQIQKVIEGEMMTTADILLSQTGAQSEISVKKGKKLVKFALDQYDDEVDSFQNSRFHFPKAHDFISKDNQA